MLSSMLGIVAARCRATRPTWYVAAKVRRRESTQESTEETAEKQEAPAKPASSGEAHTPKTDVDIDESGSLFDL